MTDIQSQQTARTAMRSNIVRLDRSPKKAKDDGLVQAHNGGVITTSLVVAEKFNKRHDNVIRAHKNLMCSDEFNALNFEEVEYVDEKGERRPMIRMTRDGFTLLAMGFTGKEAMTWKERYIAAFNQMERELLQLAIRQQNAEWAEARSRGKLTRRDLTDVVQAFVEYATTQGSKNAAMYYMNITKMEHRALFFVESALKTNLRDLLTASQIGSLVTAETVARKAMIDGMDKGMHYKDVYLLVKERVESLAAIIGKTVPGEPLPRLTGSVGHA